MILPFYNSITGGGLQVFYNYSTHYGEFIPTYSYDEMRESMSSLTYRKALSQTLDRKYQTGINIQINQWKEFSYKKNTVTGKISDVKITREGVGASAAYGGTYQFTNIFYYLYQGRIYSYTKVGATATNLLGFSLGEKSPFSLEYGLFRNKTIAGLRFGFIHFYKDISSDSVHFIFNMSF